VVVSATVYAAEIELVGLEMPPSPPAPVAVVVVVVPPPASSEQPTVGPPATARPIKTATAADETLPSAFRSLPPQQGQTSSTSLAWQAHEGQTRRRERGGMSTMTRRSGHKVKAPLWRPADSLGA